MIGIAGVEAEVQVEVSEKEDTAILRDQVLEDLGGKEEDRMIRGHQHLNVLGMAHREGSQEADLAQDHLDVNQVRQLEISILDHQCLQILQILQIYHSNLKYHQIYHIRCTSIRISLHHLFQARLHSVIRAIMVKVSILNLTKLLHNIINNIKLLHLFPNTNNTINLPSPPISNIHLLSMEIGAHHLPLPM